MIISPGVTAAGALLIFGSAILSDGVPAGEVEAAVPQPRPERSASMSIPEEITVTARRREEAVKDVPMALSVIPDSEIDAAGVYALEHVRRLVPSLSSFSFNARATSISIRGLGGNVGIANDSFESSAGVFMDGVFLGRVGSTQFELADLERVEVLRGPQGTLFGKNTTAGAINIVTRSPSLTDSEVRASASIGDYGFQQFRVSAGGPFFGNRLSGRISVASTRHDGFMENVHTGLPVQDFDDRSLRGQLLHAPSPKLTLRLIADYGRQKRHCCAAVVVDTFERFDDGTVIPDPYTARTARLGYEPLPAAPFDRRVDTDIDIAADMTQRGLSAHINWGRPRSRLVSVSAYREWDWDPRNDADSTGLPVVTLAGQANRQKQLSQELRLHLTRERASYVAGYYHFQQRVDGFAPFTYGPAAPVWFLSPTADVSPAVAEAALNGFDVASAWSPESRSNAVFGHGTWQISPAFEITAGLRFTAERRSGDFVSSQVGGADLSQLPPPDAAAAQAIRNSFSPETSYSAAVEDEAISATLNIAYRPTPNMLTYTSYALGTKSGSVNLTQLPPGVDPVVRPETVHHYEIGAKGRWLDGALALDAAIFRATIDDYQTPIVERSAGERLVQYVSNIDEARSEGVELDARWAIGEHALLSAAIAYTDAYYIRYSNAPCPPEATLLPAQCDLSGQRLAGAPARAWTLAFDGEWPAFGSRDWHLRVDYRYQSEIFTDASNSRYSILDGHSLANLNAGLRTSDGRLDIVLWIRNMFDEEYLQFINGSRSGLVIGLPGEPRTIGVTANLRL